MQFLKYLFWCLLAFVAAVFSFGNWYSVEIHLPSGLIALVNLPFLLFVTFLIGFLPMLFYHLTARWRLRQRLAITERTLDQIRGAALPVEPPIPSPAPEPLAAEPITTLP